MFVAARASIEIMRHRAVTTTKILAVALVASSTACSAKSTTQSTQNNAPPTIEKPAPNDANLLALRDELGNTSREQVLANKDRFRPLCDKDGYPLVGNLNRKSPNFEPSDYCAEVRKAR
jgi:hypothetical protein